MRKNETSSSYRSNSKNLKEYINSSLFNSYYLENGFPEFLGEDFSPKNNPSYNNFYEKFCNWVLSQDEAFFTKIQPSETTTIDRYIIPVMSYLGWDKTENGFSEHTSREITYYLGEYRYKPDLVYFHNSRDAQKTDKLQKNKEERKLHTQNSHSIVLEAKKFGLLKGKVKVTDERKDDATRDRTPEEQTVIYMDMLHSKYGVLTDGGVWKFFHGAYRDKDKFLSFDLGKLCLLILQHSKMRGIRPSLQASEQWMEEINFLISYFYNIFSYDACYGSLKSLKHLIDYTSKYSEHLEDKMKDRFIMAMNWACNGLAKSVADAGGNPEDCLSLIQRTAESHLFNIIFFRSLESRGVLPYYDEDNDYRKYSISKTVDEIYSKGFDPTKNFDNQLNMLSDYFEERIELKSKVVCKSLISLYKAVHSGFKDFKIQGFKQSIFSKEEWKFATDHLIDDQHMINVMFYLNLIPKGRRELSEYQLIPFDFLTAREIGAIYESFLDFKLVIAECNHYWNFKTKQWVKNRENVEFLYTNEVIKKGELLFTPNNIDRKMSGSYYTPHDVVEFMASRSIEKLCKDKKPIDILKIKICDPAMGSGHFLNFLLDMLVSKYLDALVLHDEPECKSYAELKSLILDSCIYGVDINPSAVKLTKMSLWLNSVEENENLKALDDQIKQGDSLLTFNWYKEFKDVFNGGGFDLIIGNPPYIYSREKFDGVTKERYQNEFQTQQYQSNTFSLFTEKSVELLKFGGELTFIVPNSVLTISTLSNFRKFLLDNGSFNLILNLTYRVFKEADLEPVIFFYDKSKVETSCLAKVVPQKTIFNKISFDTVETNSWKQDKEYRFFIGLSNKSLNIVKYLEDNSKPLSSYFTVKSGLKAYEKKKGTPKQTAKDVEQRIYDFKTRKNSKCFKYLDGNNVQHFGLDWGGTWLQYGSNLAAPRTFDIFSNPRLLIREITSKYPRCLVCAYTEETYLNNLSIVNVLPLKDKTVSDDLKVLSLILSSSLISFYFLKKTAKSERRLFPKIILKDLKRFPLKLPTIQMKKEFIRVFNDIDKLSSQSDDLAKAKLRKKMLEVDSMVFELYGIPRELIEGITEELSSVVVA
jgi:hypothetical protein